MECCGLKNSGLCLTARTQKHHLLCSTGAFSMESSGFGSITVLLQFEMPLPHHELSVREKPSLAPSAFWILVPLFTHPVSFNFSFRSVLSPGDPLPPPSLPCVAVFGIRHPKLGGLLTIRNLLLVYWDHSTWIWALSVCSVNQ